MTLFFKHILRSIKKRPLQPIVLVLTLAFSFLVSVLTLSVRTSLFEENNGAYAARGGDADIMITLAGASESRFMFAEDAKRILGDKASVTGYYELMISSADGDVFTSAAADLYTVDDIFRLEFTEYGEVLKDELSTTVLVSSELAERLSLSVNDELECELLGVKRLYRIGGISTLEFFGKYDILMDISGACEILFERYSFAAALGEDFRPCNTVFIKMKDKADTESAISALSADAAFSDFYIQDISTDAYGEAHEELLFVIIDFAIVLCCVMACAVAYSCFSILSAERRGENYSFKAAGASSSFLALMQYAEALAYWVAGAALGLALSVPTLLLANSILDFKYTRMEMTPSTALIALALLLLSVLLSVSVFLIGGRRKRRLRVGKALLIALAAVTALLYLATFLLPRGVKMTVGMGALLLFLVLIFLLSSSIFKAVVCKADRLSRSLLSKRGRIGTPVLHYSIKNLKGVVSMHGIIRMTGLLISALLCVFYLITSLKGEVRIIEAVFDAEHIVLNGSRRCYERISECESVSSAVRAYMSEASHANGVGTSLISVENIDALNDDFGIVHQPQGNEAVISYGEARALSLSIGDMFTVKHGNTEIELRLAGIVRTGMPLVLFDCEHFGIDHSVLLPSRADGLESEDMLREISAITAEEVAAVVGCEDLFERILHNADTFLKSGGFLLAFIFIFSFVGIADTFSECYRSRREEFALYRSAGTTRREIALMKLTETAVCLVFSLLIGVVGFLVIAPLIDEALLSICYDVRGNFEAFFRR